MNASPREAETPRWYAEAVRRHGYGHEGLGFRTAASQQRRFEALLALGDFHGRTLLDAGCGFGDFLAFLQARGIEPRYTGLDSCAPMVARCRERFAGQGARFVPGDALAPLPGGGWDYVVASGLFGLDADGVRERLVPTLARLFAASRVGLAVNFLSARAPIHAAQRLYADPARMLEAALALTPAVRLDHGYLPNDFTLHLYKKPSWERGGGPDETRL